MSDQTPKQPSLFSLGQIGLLPQEEMLEAAKKQRKITIGIPKELSKYESRVPLTPQAAEILTQDGHEVVLESGAGKGANYEDVEYSEAGVRIVDKKEEVLQCEVILKVAPLSCEEIDLMPGRQILISSIQVAAQTQESIKKLMTKRITAIAFEYLRDENDHNPALRSISEVAGISSVMVASECLSNANNGKGVLLGGITGITPTEVVVIGAGTTGEYAVKAALGLGALVKVFDSSLYRLMNVQKNIGRQLFTSVLQPKVLEKNLKSADVVIAATNQIDMPPGYILTEDMVKQMKRGTVIVDLSVDNGSCIETSKVTSHSSPNFTSHGVIHYCVPNISSRFARTSSIALSNVFVPMLKSIGESGNMTIELKENFGLRKGTYIFNGILTNKHISKTFRIPFKDMDLLLAAF